MEDIKTIIVNRSAYANNDLEADLLRDYLFDHRTFLINVMSSPGAGKTTTLIKLINALKDTFKIGVMEADIDSNVDAINVAKETGVKSIQLHTSGMCHLDAGMTKTGLDEIGANDLDLIFLENVGNLVCPAEFDTGATMDMVILSIPEGDDKPLKYPLMFEVSNFVLINKIDVIDYFDFDLEKCKENIKYRNPMADIFEVCSKDGRGIEEVAEYIKQQIYEWRK